jgi:hypothetical protein
MTGCNSPMQHDDEDEVETAFAILLCLLLSILKLFLMCTENDRLKPVTIK